MDAEELFLQHVKTIERICAFVCRRNHFIGDEIAEFTQETKFRLLDNDYAIIRKFESRSSFSTYLNTVINRLFQQYRTEQWGKWRPSAEAKRLGDKAVTLERLMTRDGLTFDEAVQTLTTRCGGVYTAAELEAIHLRLPTRTPRPVLVSDDAVPEAVAAIDGADERVLAEERDATARSTVAAVDRIIAALDAEDRLILHMRFCEARKVPDIAQRLHFDQKKLYKRLDKLFAMMRKELERAGVRRADIDVLLTHGDHELQFGFTDEESEGSRPSHPRDEVGRGKGRVR